MRVGFVGLGNMGGNMALRLQRAGYALGVCDLDRSKADALIAAGATWCDSLHALVDRSDVVISSLPGPKQSERFLFDDDGLVAAAQDGKLWIDTTTNSRALVARGASALAEKGMRTIDCPATGAVDGARTGRLTLFAGGDAADLVRAEPVLKHLGRVIHCGPLGCGNAVKLVTNQLWFVHAAALGEGLALGRKAGVDLAVLWDAIKNSVGDSFVARHDAPSIFAGHYDPSFTLDLCLKDLGLIRDLAEEAGVSIPLSLAARARFDEAGRRYGGAGPELLVAKLIEEDSDVDLRLPGDWPKHWEA